MSKKKQDIKSEDYTYQTVLNLSSDLGVLSNKGISVPTLVNVFGLKEEIKTHITRYVDLQKEIMKKFEVADDGGKYEFKDHPEQAQILKELEELTKLPVSFKNLNFMTAKEFSVATEGKRVDELFYLWSLIVQK